MTIEDLFVLDPMDEKFRPIIINWFWREIKKSLRKETFWMRWLWESILRWDFQILKMSKSNWDWICYKIDQQSCQRLRRKTNKFNKTELKSNMTYFWLRLKLKTHWPTNKPRQWIKERNTKIIWTRSREPNWNSLESIHQTKQLIFNTLKTLLLTNLNLFQFEIIFKKRKKRKANGVS